jgi:limonene-1,2-epoxide hydrolase
MDDGSQISIIEANITGRIMIQKLTPERIRELWGKTYNQEGKPDWSHLFPCYHEDIVFEDSIQRIEGIEAFTAMCNRLASRCEQLNMNILSVMVEDDQAFLEWEMVMMFKRFPSTPVYGCTKLTMGEDQRIIYQRDYFDLWGDIFNGIPGFAGLYRRFMHRYFG